MAAAGGLSELAKSVLETVGKGLPSEDLVIALSGGADSAVAAWAVQRLGDEVRAIHVDHGLAASDELRQAARAVATALAIELDVVTVEVPPGPSAEDQARRVRHQALLDGLKLSERLVSGHTADDQAETILGNVIRGTGAAGLGGIPAMRGRWVRPLLSVRRRETRALARELGLPFADDPQNSDLTLRRNHIRHELIPHLEAEYNPDVAATLLRTGQLAVDDDRQLEAWAANIPVHIASSGVVSVPAAALVTLSKPVASRVARHAIRAAGGPYAGSYREVAAVLAVAAADPPSVSLADALQVSREGAMVVLHGTPLPPPVPVPLQLEGSTDFDGFTIVSRIVASPQPRPLAGAVALLDASALERGAVVRSVGHGERIDMVNGHKGVRKTLAEAGVPSRLRSGWPVVVVDEKVAWVVGVRPAAWAMPSSDSARLVRLELERPC